MNLTKDQIALAVRWRMGLERDKGGAKHDWHQIERWMKDRGEQLDKLAQEMAVPLIEVIQWGLVQSKEVTQKWPQVPTCWNNLKSYLKKHDELSHMMANHAAQFLGATVKKDSASVALNQPSKNPKTGNVQATGIDEASTPAISPIAQAPTMSVFSEADDLDELETLPVKASSQPDDLAAAPAADQLGESSNHMSDQTESANETSSPSASTQWRYLPVPDEPEKHEEFDSQNGESHEKLKIIGARVRGKKHKHEGTNCDDWFEFDTSSPWTIIAVSDGAGSKRFSRVGAKVSCQRALAVLRERLKDHWLTDLDWSNLEEVFKQDREKGVFIKPDIDTVRVALHDAMQEAYDAVAARARELSEDAEYEKLLGRPVTLDDLAGTLLLAVHLGVRYNDKTYSFMMSCQIGDGMLAAVDQTKTLKLLGIADSGEFAGQTEFLTSKKKLEKNNLWSKTNGFWGELQALMVMTDGVADDYFPNNPGMLQLYGDLVLNSILRFNFKGGPPDITASLASTNLPNLDAIREAELTVPVETITVDGPQTVYIRSISTYAQKLGRPFEEVIKDPGLLLAGGEGKPMCDENEPKDRLRVWLDAYQVRGSFDDRTLVVLYREEMT